MARPRLPGRRLLVLDGAAAAGFTVLPWLAGLRPDGTAWWAAAAGAGLPVAVRRIWPVPVFLAVLVDVCAAIPLRLGPTSLLALAYSAYLVSVSRVRRRQPSAVVVGAAAAVGAAGLLATGSRHAPGATYVSELTLGVVAVCAAWAAGVVVRERREGARRLVEQTLERAKAEERLRVARDVHDVVTHSMGLIVVRASVANHLAGEHPEEAQSALADIERISRGAMADLRTTLRMLRRDDPAAAHADPAPKLSDLSSLLATAEAAGVQVELKAGVPAALPDAVELSVFRIVQEALTNVVRHAAPTRCTVAIAADQETVTIEVCDDGPGPGHRAHGLSGGLGLVGMHERAAAHGGSLIAGPRPEGGFAVRAVLPY
jgi:signal transduction histidine kinase